MLPFKEEIEILELECVNCGPSYFEGYKNGFNLTCTFCEVYDQLNPNYVQVIPDIEMLTACNNFHLRISDTPDISLAKKYTQNEIFAKLDELDHRNLIEWGVSIRTAWLTLSEAGKKLLGVE